MPQLPASGPLSMDDIDTEFGLGTDLDSYRGAQWWKNNAATGFFDEENIDIAEFYGKRGSSPVTPGNTTITTSGYFTVPTYSTLTVVLFGGSGGGSGGNGSTTPGSSGSAGTPSYFGAYASGDFGRGGTPSSAGVNGSGSVGSPAGGSGGSSSISSPGNRGGHSGRTQVSLTNPSISGTGPAIGASVYVTVGQGGAGGAGGTSVTFYPGIGWLPISEGAGSNGSNGYVYIAWS